ncbi:Uncharacterized protein GBIM_13103 [Gryllus bimaculatus]|nr:Uncharacterized protein GBIM_13103 [Gryllus bimaculatus]
MAPSATCCSPRHLVLHVLDASSLILVLVLQGSVLNYYIIDHYKSSVNPYFWFLADFATVFVFAGTLTISYQYLTKVRFAENDSKLPSGAMFPLSPKRLTRRFPVSRLGIMPLSYCSWLIYCTFLLSKIVLIVRSGILYDLSPQATFGPQLLQITIALSGVVFLLLVEGHNWAPRGSPRYLFVTLVCGKTAIEILDTVSLLSLLHTHPVRHLGALHAALQGLEIPITVLCCFNFVLPALALYKLSLTDVSAEVLALPVSLLYNLLHMMLIDLPYLGVRLYLWLNYDHSTSVLLMKNVFGIILALRGLIPDVTELVRRRRTADGTPKPAAANGYLEGGAGELLELQPVPCVKEAGDAAAEGDCIPRLAIEQAPDAPTSESNISAHA